jgi:TonB family protein
MKNFILCSLLMIFTCVGTVRGDSKDSQGEPEQKNFRGYFVRETSESGVKASGKNKPISAEAVFRESESGEKYVFTMPFFANLSPRHEYDVQGIVVQDYLPEKAKDADYRQIAQAAWPDSTPSEIKNAAKTVKAWIKKHPGMPLLLVNTLRRARDQQYKVDGRVQESKLLKKVEPVYSTAMMAQRIQGVVRLELVVDEDGNVEQLKVLSGHPLLSAAAVTAVRQWKYSPTLVDEVPVPVLAHMIVTFGTFSRMN